MNQISIKVIYAKNPQETKYQFLIKKRKNVGTKHLNHSKAFSEYSNDMQNVNGNIEEYNPGRKRKVLIVFDDTIADIPISSNLIQQ